MIVEIENKLQKMNKSEIFQICRKMKCQTGTKREMIGSLLRPLGKNYKMKYKMEKIRDKYLKELMSEYYTDSDLGALRATSKFQKDLQPILDKRSRTPAFASSLLEYFSIISIAASLAPPCNGPLKVPIAPVIQECISDKVDAQVLAVNVDALKPCSA